MSRGSNGRETFFGLEFTHAKDPQAIVFKTSRRGKLIKWVDSYEPTAVVLPTGGNTLRERTGIQCPAGFMLRKDEIATAMKEKKTENYQNGKFFVIMNHVIRKYRHPKAEPALKEALIKNTPKGDTNGEDKSGTGKSAELVVSGEHSATRRSAGPFPIGTDRSDASGASN